jgi:hemerythrin-like metal-binding protein
MDVQHHRLAGFVEQLRDERRRGVERSRISQTLSYLVQYLHIHFADEEQFMALNGYPKMLDHAREHQVLYGSICEFQSGFESGRFELNEEIINGMFERLNSHIREYDVPYGEYFVLARTREE